MLFINTLFINLKVKSEKATNSAKANIDPSRLGRLSFAVFEPEIPTRWAKLVKKHDNLIHIGAYSSKKHLTSRSKTIRDKKTKKVDYELPADTHAQSVKLVKYMLCRHVY